MTSNSLVFSYWTRTLDLAENYLRSSSINFLRIDGNVDFKRRLEILQQFRTLDVPVLLMSIQTGAVG